MPVMNAGVADLLPGEEIRWEGRPLRHGLFRSTDTVFVPFTLVWFGLAVAWEAAVLGRLGEADGPPVWFALGGIPFVLVGLYLVGGRFIVRAVASRRIRYLLTDRRVVVVDGLSGRRVTSHDLTSLRPPVVVDRHARRLRRGPLRVPRLQPRTRRLDGSGSLAFGRFPSGWDCFDWRSGVNPWSSEPGSTPVLRDIPDIARVRDLVASAQSDRDSNG